MAPRALRQRLGSGEHIIRLTNDPNTTSYQVRFVKLMELGTASMNGDIIATPTHRAYRWLDPTDDDISNDGGRGGDAEPTLSAAHVDTLPDWLDSQMRARRNTTTK